MSEIACSQQPLHIGPMGVDLRRRRYDDPTQAGIAHDLIGAPLILWAMLYLIARYSALNMRLVVPWIRTLRWLTWLTTMCCFLWLCTAVLPLRLPVSVRFIGRDVD